VAGEVLIKFAEDVNREKATTLLPKWGARIMNDQVVPGRAWGRWIKAALPDDTSMETALEKFSGMPEVEIVQPNYIYRIAAVPSDPNFDQLWGLENTGQLINDPKGSVVGTEGIDMDLPTAWDDITDCSSVRVAVIDTGINYNQQDLAANMWDGTGCPAGYGGCPNHGYDFVGAGDDNPMDMNGHGTHVAGSIGAVANNGVGVAGVCWAAEIVAVRTMQADGAGTSEDISEGMRFAADAGAKVINMSLGGTGEDPILLAAANHIRTAGAILVTAAGNSSNNTDVIFDHPGCYNLDNIINVAAVTPRGQLASFSNYGAVSVDVGGPGSSVLSTYAGQETFHSLPEGSWTVSPGGADWAFSDCIVPGISRVLSNPSTFCSGGEYANDIDDRTWFSMNLNSYDSAYLLFELNLEVASGDFFRAAYTPAGGDPFSTGTTLFSLQNTTTENEFLLYGMPLDACTTAACSFGFQLETGPSGQARGVALNRSGASMTLVGLTLDTDTYSYMNGTSMAAPNVAGVAALLWARYPSATYREIVLAVFDGTTPLRSLAVRTCTGGMVSASGSLDKLAEWLQ
jgi:subtilisin family serine protease